MLTARFNPTNIDPPRSSGGNGALASGERGSTRCNCRDLTENGEFTRAAFEYN
jgi:hypothetical protein